MKTEKWRKDLWQGLKAAINSWQKALLTLSISAFTFILLSLSNSPAYSIQMFSAGIEYWIPAIQMRISGTYLSSGFTGLTISTVYSLAVGVALTNFGTQLKNTGANFRDLSGIAPGFIAAGCAGCGVGLLGFIGLTGALAALPMQGLGVQVAGLGLLFYFIGKTGDPKTCTIPAES